MAATAGLMSWGLRHTEASFADGLRYIRQAEQIHRGDWQDGLVGSIDHPLHPLGIVAAHGLVGGEGPVSWQRAAVALAFGCIVLLVIPLYLLTRDAFGAETAWLGCLLVMANPLFNSILANVLSESSFLLFWTWGFWTAIRFLREGRFCWLPLTISFGVLAYLSRPEGLLLPMAMVLTLGGLASAPRHANQLAAVGGRGGVPGVRLARSGRSLHGLEREHRDQARDRAGARSGSGLAPPGPGAGTASSSRPDHARDLPPGDGKDGQSRAWGGFDATRSPGPAGAGRDATRSCARTDLVVLRGRAAGVGDRARQAARDRRILHGASRSGSGTHLNPCRGAWPDLDDGQDLDSRRLAGSGRATAPAGSRGLGGLACGSDRRAPAARLGAVDTGTLPCLSRCRRLAGPERRGRRAGPGPHGLVALFQPAAGLSVRQCLRGPGRFGSAVGHRSQTASGRTLELLGGGTPACRPARSRGADTCQSRAGSASGPDLRPTPPAGPGRGRELHGADGVGTAMSDTRCHHHVRFATSACRGHRRGIRRCRGRG